MFYNLPWWSSRSRRWFAVMTRWLSKIAKFFVVLLLVMVVLVLLLVAVLQTEAVRGFVLDRTLSAVNDELAGTIEVDRLEGSLLGQARAKGVRIYDGRGRLAADAPVAELRFQILPLLFTRVMVDEVRLEGPLVVVRTYDDGVLNWLTLTEETVEEEAPDAQVVVAEMVLVGAKVAYLDEMAPYEDVPGLSGFRSDRIEELDGLRRGAEVAEAWREAWRVQGMMEPAYATPRGPVALFVDDLKAEGAAEVAGDQVVVSLTEVAAQVGADLFSPILAVSVSEVDVEVSASTVTVAIPEVSAPGWFQASGLWLGLRVAPEGSEDAMEAMVFEIESGEVGPLALGWAVPDVPLPSAVNFDARLALDARKLALTANLSVGDGSPVSVAVEMSDYDQDRPGYALSARGDGMVLSRWLHEEGLPEVEGDLLVAATGEGFEPADLSARLRGALVNARVEETYEVDLFEFDVEAVEGVFEGHRLGALTPYLDVYATFRFDPEGEARASVRTTADREQADEVARLGTLGGWAEARPSTATLIVDGDLRFDPVDLERFEAEEFLDGIHGFDVDGTWEFEDFQAEDIRVARSTGSVVARGRGSAGRQGNVVGDYLARASVDGLVVPGLVVRDGTLTDRGEFTVRLSEEDPMELVRAFNNNLEVEARGVRTPDLTMERGLLSARVDKRPGLPRRIRAQLEGEVDGLRSGEITVAAAEAGFQTQVDLVPFEVEAIPEPFDLVRAFEAVGELSVREIGAGEVGVTSATVSTALSGALDAPEGTVSLEVDGVSAGEFDFQSVVGEVELLEGRRGEFLVQAHLSPEKYYFLGANVAYSRGYEAFAVEDLRLGSDRVEWVARDGGVLRWENEELQAQEMTLDNGEQSMGVDGWMRPGHSQDLMANLSRVRVDDLRRDFHLEEMIPDVAGVVGLEAHLSGTTQRPVLQAGGSLREGRFEGYGPFAARFQVRYEDEVLEVERFDASAYGKELIELTARLPMVIDLEGQAEPIWDRPVAADARVLPVQLREFHEPIPELNDFGVDGEVEGWMRLRGELNDPVIDLGFDLRRFRFEGEVDGDFISLRDVEVSSRLEYASPESGGHGIDASAVATWEGEPVGELELQTPLPLERWLYAMMSESEEPLDWQEEFLELPLRLRVMVPGFDLERIPLESLQEQRLRGEVDLNIDLDGALGDPRGTVSMDLKSLGWDRFQDLSLVSEVRLADRHAHIDELSFSWGDDEIFMADGSVPLPIAPLLAGETVEDVPLNFRWELRETPISRLSPIDYEFARVRGSLGAFVELGGTLRNPRFRARAGVFNTQLGDGNPGTFHVEVTGGDNEVQIDGALCYRVDPFLSFNGRAPILLDIVELARGTSWQLPGDLRFHVESEEIDLARVIPTQLISDFLVDPDGRLALDVEVFGNWEEPRIGGFLQIDEGALTLPEFARRFTDINGRMDFDDRELEISRFELADGSSSLSLTGTVGHEFFVPDAVSLSLSADEFNLGGFGIDFPVFVTAETEVNGNLQGEPGEMNVSISGLNVELTDEWDRTLHRTELDEDIVVLRREAQRLSEDLLEGEEGPRGLQLRVNVVIARDAWARHPNGQLNFQADLSADISGTMVTMTGNVDALRGDLEFLGRRFIVQESQVIFVGAHPPNPRLQLEAHYILPQAVAQALGTPSSGEPRIVFRVSGTADTPRLELSADPPMSETEILYVLLTGRPPDRTGVGQEEGVASQALSAVGGIFVEMLQDELEGLVPFDVVRLEAGEGGLRGTRLEIGHYPRSDLYLSIRRQLRAEEDQASTIYRAEYHFLPRWMAELSWTNRNEGGLTIYFDVY